MGHMNEIMFFFCFSRFKKFEDYFEEILSIFCAKSVGVLSFLKIMLSLSNFL